MTDATETGRARRHPLGGRRAWAIWGVGLAVYVLAIFHRTSLGVAGILAAERFHINAAQLSTFTVLQLLMYAGAQVPVGVLLDRFGSKPLMLGGVTLMTLGQVGFALAGTFPAGLVTRALIGIGDAMIFTSVLRLVALWFPVRRAPVITQLTGMIGQLGAVAAAAPLAAALHGWGWTPAYLAASSVGVLLGVLLVLVVRNSPYAVHSVEKIKVRALYRTLREVWGSPGTKLGLWTHGTTQFAPTVFTLLWGYPFLVEGQGLSPATAATLLTMMTFTGLVTGPVLGTLTGRLPYYRSYFVLGIIGAIAAMWTVVLLLPGRAPLWLLVLLVVVTSLGGPGSMVGFDMARTFHPEERIGRATGIVNMGGFIASLLTMTAIGVVLDWLSPGGGTGGEPRPLSAYRVALCAQYAVWGVGAFMIWRYRRRSISHLGQHPGALDALRGGEALVPGLSRARQERAGGGAQH